MFCKITSFKMLKENVLITKKVIIPKQIKFCNTLSYQQMSKPLTYKSIANTIIAFIS